VNLYPAIDLKDNKCVRLTKGKDNTSVIFNEDPVDQAIYFEQSGCKRLHVVDLDAAFGRKNINTKSINDIRKAIKIPIQVGGGIRNETDVKRLFDKGMDYLIIGSLAVTNYETVIKFSDLYKNKIYVSLDVLDNKIMIKGWEEKTNYETKEIFNKYNNTNIKGFVLTDVDRDGTLNGLNIDMIKTNLKLASKPLVVGGGLTSYNDLNNLKKIFSENLEGIIAGKSFYVGNIDLKKAQDILNSNA
jgi:phosphoribosylformimino-5-aminoimidazole carboxamide ribotide isomerase